MFDVQHLARCSRSAGSRRRTPYAALAMRPLPDGERQPRDPVFRVWLATALRVGLAQPWAVPVSIHGHRRWPAGPGTGSAACVAGRVACQGCHDWCVCKSVGLVSVSTAMRVACSFAHIVVGCRYAARKLMKPHVLKIKGAKLVATLETATKASCRNSTPHQRTAALIGKPARNLMRCILCSDGAARRRALQCARSFACFPDDGHSAQLLVEAQVLPCIAVLMADRTVKNKGLFGGTGRLLFKLLLCAAFLTPHLRTRQRAPFASFAG